MATREVTIDLEEITGTAYGPTTVAFKPRPGQTADGVTLPAFSRNAEIASDGTGSITLTTGVEILVTLPDKYVGEIVVPTGSGSVSLASLLASAVLTNPALAALQAVVEDNAELLTGPQGPAGPTGATGATGPQGAAGATGATGPQGPAGPAGTNGTNGANGADGKTVLNGTGAPSGGLGTDGDFYLDTAASRLYGPKTAGAWGSGVSLIGPQGPAGELSAGDQAKLDAIQYDAFAPLISFGSTIDEEQGSVAALGTGIAIEAGNAVAVGTGVQIAVGGGLTEGLIGIGSGAVVSHNTAQVYGYGAASHADNTFVFGTDGGYDDGGAGRALTASFSFNNAGTSLSTSEARLAIVGRSSNTNNRPMVSLGAVWGSATDASRRARGALYAHDSSAARECFRWEANSSAARIGFYGATAAAKQTISGSRGGNAALASLLTALATLGLVTDSTSA